MRIGLVGAGAIAQSWLEALRREPRAELVGVVDPDREAARAAAEPFGAAVHEELTPLLDDGVDLVVVATPPNSHADLAIEALDRDVSVLCEKPLAVGSDAAAKMTEAADASAGILSMASKFRFVDGVIRARSMIQSGIFGDVVWLRNTFSAPVDMRDRWNADPSVSGGGVLIDNGTHSVDLCRYLLGPIVAVHALEGHRPEGLAVEDTVQVQLRAESGAVATVNLSWSLKSTSECYVEIDGINGHACVGWAGSRFTTSTAAGWAEFSRPYDKHDAFTRNLADVVDAVEHGQPPLVGTTEAMASVRAVEAAYESLRSGGWVEI